MRNGIFIKEKNNIGDKSMADKNKSNQYSKPGGGFRKGNPGRPKGIVSGNVQLARRLTAENSEKLLKKVNDFLKANRSA